MEIIDTGIDSFYCGDLQGPAPYYAAVINNIENAQGCWNYVEIGIFERREKEPNPDADKKIGGYIRNYSTPHRTFHPFKLRGKWYALYSKNYTSTRVMSLPECKDLGGEERNAFGFCPVDYFVPGLNYIEAHHDEECPRNTNPPDYGKACTCTITHDHGCPCCPETEVPNQSCTCKETWKKWEEEHYIWKFPDRVHGFVAGCIWGDDSSWKIQYLDLSRADEGIITRDDSFGYIELPDSLTLDKAIELDVNDENGNVYGITIDGQKHFYGDNLQKIMENKTLPKEITYSEREEAAIKSVKKFVRGLTLSSGENTDEKID